MTQFIKSPATAVKQHAQVMSWSSTFPPRSHFSCFSLARLKSSLVCWSRSGRHTTSTAVIARALAVLRVNSWAFSAPGTWQESNGQDARKTDRYPQMVLQILHEKPRFSHFSVLPYLLLQCIPSCGSTLQSRWRRKHGCQERWMIRCQSQWNLPDLLQINVKRCSGTSHDPDKQYLPEKRSGCSGNSIPKVFPLLSYRFARVALGKML